MKKAFVNSLISSIGIFIFSFILHLNGQLYGQSMYSMIEKDYPGFMMVVEDYGKNNFEPVYEGYTKAEVVALDALSNRSFSVKDTEKDLKQMIKDADPFNSESNDEKVITLKEAVKVVQQIKDKYYVKAKIVNALIESVSLALWIFIFYMIVEGISRLIWGKKGPSWERDYEAEKDNRVEEDEYYSRRVTDKPKGLN